MISPKRRKYQQALTDGRLLRNAKGHIVKPAVIDPGVVLTRSAHAIDHATIRPDRAKDPA